MEGVSDELDAKNCILGHVAMSSAHFKSQQIGDPDLTEEEKRQIAEAVLEKSPSLFLSKFGKYLMEEHLEYFKGSDDYEVNFYLAELSKGKMKPKNKSQIRNRRLEALKRLSEKGDYFSDLEMKQRNPLMFEELVGQYLTKEEKKLFETNDTPVEESFSGFVFDMVEKNRTHLKLKTEVQSDYDLMGTVGKKEEPQGVALWGEISDNSKQVLANSRFKDITTDQQEMLLNEFRSQVYSDFLSGKDYEFDYSQVDSNADYDDLTAMEIDQQDNYFDAESPKTVQDEDSISD